MKHRHGVKQVDGAMLTPLEKEPGQGAGAETTQLECYSLVVKIEPELLMLLGDEEGVCVCVYVPGDALWLVAVRWGLLIWKFVGDVGGELSVWVS
jgi:hypothetical protein